MHRRVGTFIVAIAAITGGCLVATVGSASSAPTVDWPQFGRTAGHTGNEAEGFGITRASVHTLHVAWSGTLGGGATSSSPVIAGGNVYVGNSDGRLSVFNVAGCLDAFSICDPVWQGVTRNGIYGAPAIAGTTVLVASADRFLYAFPAGGCDLAPICKPLWRGQLKSAALASVTVVGDTAYVSTYRGRLLAFAVSGCGQPVCQPAWSADMKGLSSSSPAVGSGLVFVDSYHGNHGWLWAFPAHGCDAATCAPVWSASLGGPAFSTPTVADGRVYTGTARGAVDVFAATGCGAGECSPLWRARTGDTFTQGAPAVRGDTFYVTAQGSPDPNRVGVVEAFPVAGCDAEVCDPIWTGVNGASGFESAAVVVGDVVLVAKGPASGVPVDAGVYAFAARGCGGAITCDPLDFAQVGIGQNYLGSSIAVAQGRVAFASFDNTTNRSALYVLQP